MRVPDIKTVEWIAGVDAVDALMPTFHTQTLEQGFAVIRGLVAPDRVDEVARDVRAACSDLG